MAVWGPIDVFRVTDGKIVEHWAGRDSAAVFRAISQTPLAAPATAGASVSVERLTYAPGAGTAVRRNTQVRVASLEAGALDVRLDGIARLDRSAAEGDTRLQETVVIKGEVRLRPGDALVLPVEAAYRIRNLGREPAVSTEVTIAVSQPLTPMSERAGSAAIAGNVTADLLASGLIPPFEQAITVGVGRVTLAPGARVPAHGATGSELYLVEAGTIEPGSDVGTAWAIGDPIDTGSGLEASVLTSGGGVLFPPGAVGPWHNGGEEPVVLLVVTIQDGEFIN